MGIISVFNKMAQRFSSRGGIAGQVTRSSDIALVFLLVAIIGLIIVPVHPVLLDMLIATNLAVSVSLIIVSIYIPGAVHLSVFPSLLLITTLFRLGLNIASTRNILLHAYAGKIIKTFGEFVVGGNYVVGGVIFLIITIVQFIVVTKGAERVAEVVARFTLDAMPGKQMSIDADLRGGVIDADSARQKRLDLAKESQLYGSMDGAMKFVKGDVIAGIVITIINIVGGLIIGIMMNDMSAMQAAKVYSLLSIGDGLVSQIPSLLIALTAGIVITRVSGSDEKTNLGSEISTQLLRQPKALFIASCVVVLMAFIPGMPKPQFGILALALGSLSYFVWKKERARKRLGLAEKSGAGVMEATGVEGHGVISRGGIDSYALTLPVILETGNAITNVVREQQKKGASFIEEIIPKMRQALYQDSGVRFPGVHVRTDAPGIAEEEYSILLNEVPVIRGKVLGGYLLTNETEDNLKRYNLPFKSYKNSLNLPSLWVEDKYREILEKAGIKFWTVLEVVALHLSYFFRHYAGDFVGIQEVKAMIEFIEKSFPDLVKEVTRMIPLQKMTEIFTRLIQEQVSVKDLRTILEALSEWAQTEKDTVLLTEYVRASLKRYISYKYSQGQSVLSVYLLDSEIEDMVRGAIKQTSAGSYIALDPDSVQLILQAVRDTVSPTPPGGQPPVLLTSIDVRRFVRKLIEMEFPEISVVSYQEIIPEIRIQPLGRIQIS